MFMWLITTATILIASAHASAQGYLIVTHLSNGACKGEADYTADFIALRTFPNIQAGPVYVRLSPGTSGCSTLSHVGTPAIAHNVKVIVDSMLPVDGRTINFDVLTLAVDEIHTVTRYVKPGKCGWLAGVAITAPQGSLSSLTASDLQNAVTAYTMSNGSNGSPRNCQFFIGLVAPAGIWKSPGWQELRGKVPYWLVEYDPFSSGSRSPAQAAATLTADIEALLALSESSGGHQVWVIGTGWPSSANQAVYWKAVACPGGVASVTTTFWRAAFDESVARGYGLAGANRKPKFDLSAC